MYKTLALLTLLAPTVFAQSLRDPTQPLGHRSSADDIGLKLHSVLISETRTLAVINGELVREGEALERLPEVTVEKINRSDVVLKRNGKTMVLKLLDQPETESIKTDRP